MIKKYTVIYSILVTFLISNLYFIYDPKMKFISEKFYLMGTHGNIQIFVKDVQNGNLAIKNAIQRIKNIEKILTKFASDSDISKINRYPFIYNYVSFDTIFNLEFAKQIYIMTNGYFDIGVGDILSVLGIDDIIPEYNHIKLKNFKYSLFNIDNSLNVKLIRPNTMIDLGGIGKGFAIDEAIKTIINFGITHVAIEFGGDIRVNYNMPSGRKWIITFDNKLSFFFKSKSKLKVLKLNNSSIAISGGYLKKSKKSISIKHHIINPKSLNSNKYLCVIIIGKENIICDSLATASYNMNFLSLCKTKTIFTDYIFKLFI